MMQQKWFTSWVLLLWLAFTPLGAQAQPDTLVLEEYNPFELIHRLNKEQQQAIQTVEVENPFDVAPPAALVLKQIKDAQKYKGRFWLEVGRFDGDRDVPQAWLLAFILPLLLSLTVISVAYRPFLEKLPRYFTREASLALAYRNSKGSDGFQQLLLSIFSICSFACFGLVLLLGGYVNTENLHKAALAALSLSAIYWIGKNFLWVFTKWTFEEEAGMGMYQYALRQYNHLLAIALMPLTLLLAFAPSTVLPGIRYLALAAVGLWWLARISKSLQMNTKYIAGNIFRFFAYLCTVEIAPIIILFTTIRLILGH